MKLKKINNNNHPTMPSNKNAKKNVKSNPHYTCNCPDKMIVMSSHTHSETKQTVIVIHVNSGVVNEPLIISKFITQLLTFEKTANKGELFYHLWIECCDSVRGVSKNGTQDFTVRDVLDWLVPFMKE